MPDKNDIEILIANKIKNSEPESFDADQEWAKINPSIKRFNFRSWNAATFNVYYLSGLILSGMTVVLLFSIMNKGERAALQDTVRTEETKMQHAWEYKSDTVVGKENIQKQSSAYNKTYKEEETETITQDTTVDVYSGDTNSPVSTEAVIPEAKPGEKEEYDFYEKYSRTGKDSSGEKLFIPVK